MPFPVICYLFFGLLQSALVKSTCYFPSGDPTEDTQCNANSSDDYCCGKDSICFGNKVCLNNDGAFARGSCTDNTWKSKKCPFFCVSENPSNGVPMIACPPLSLGTWCCKKTIGDNCCTDPHNLLTLGQASIVSSPFSASSTSGSLSVSTTTESPASTSTPSSAAPASPRTSAATPTAVPPSSSGLADSAKVGIGISIPLGAIMIALLLYLLYRNKQQRGNTRSRTAEGKDHWQPGIANDYQQQTNLAELQQYRDPHELASEPLRHQS